MDCAFAFKIMKALHLLTLTFIAMFLALVLETNCTSYLEDITLTQQQLTIFNRFKAQVWNNLPQEWMKDDLFILRFLKARNFDIPRAQTSLNAHLKWREQNSMETIQNEDWSDYHDIVYDVNGRDRQGRPIVTWTLAEWDVRKAVLAGKLPRLVRYNAKMWDAGLKKVMELQKQGQNVTRAVFLLNMDNINVAQHVNPASIPYYLRIATAFLANYPNLADTIILINTPGFFETVLSVVRPVFGDLLMVYGKEKRIWKPALDKIIDPSQLPPSFGGTAAGPN